MKKLLLLAVLSAFATASFSQPSLQYPQNAPEIGDITEIQFVSPQGLSPMPMGPNVSWDFSQLNNIGAPGEISVISPASAPSGNEFPEANIVLKMNDTIFTYAKVDENRVEYLGTKASFFGFDALVVFSDYKKQMDYPFPFGAAYTDTYAGTSSVATAEIKLDASTAVLYDAYGAIILPNGTFENVIRTKSTDIEVDSIIVAGFLVKTVSVIRDRYCWYTQDGFNPIFSMEIQDVNGMIDTVCYYTTSVAGVSDKGTLALSGLNTYPNPAKEHLNISFNSICSGPVRITVVNQLGNIMMEDQLKTNSLGLIKEELDISRLPAGVYFISIDCSRQHQLTSKFIKK